MRPIACTLVLAVALLGPALPAAAHAHLKSALPPPGGSVAAAPRALSLTFSEAVNARFTGVTIAGPGAAAVSTGPVAPGAAADTILVPLPDALAPGLYEVDWHALAVDGHKTTGRYGFTIKP